MDIKKLKKQNWCSKNVLQKTTGVAQLLWNFMGLGVLFL